MSFATRLRTYARLGVSNIARVARYRLGLKSGRHPVQKLQADVAKGPFYRASEKRGDLPPANTTWDENLWWFGWHQMLHSNTPPDWFANPFTNLPSSDSLQDWWQIPDFGGGDIKGVWELSRMDWVVAWSTKGAHGDTATLSRLNEWLADWAIKNPPYKGPNWKCGQEASIRVMHMILAAWVLGQDRTPESGLVSLLIAHLQRIAPTITYAIGQQNNHGTSEAAALFIGGTFLSEHDKRADEWARNGRRWLENRAKTLIEPDGSFSQYSVNYHRLMLDSYSLAEAWRRYRDLPAFSRRLNVRLSAASRWLDAMIDRQSGDAPNMGANDGAHLLQLTGCDYRDFRPSAQLAAALFEGRDAFGTGPWTAPQQWLSVPKGIFSQQPKSTTFGNGGYHVLRYEKTFVVLRFPRFCFRPSQADALHVDLWHNGENLLRDAGTYSYNSDATECLSGTSAHNTVEFDGRDQMPRLGKFLFGNWINADRVKSVHIDQGEVVAGAGYVDNHGASHHREVRLSGNRMKCIDTISGTFRTAILRWRLPPGTCKSSGFDILGNGIQLSIHVNGNPTIPIIGTTFESRYYQQRSELPEVTVTVDSPSTVTTEVAF